MVQDKSDNAHGVSVNIVRDDAGIFLKTDLSQTVEQMTVDGLWRFVRILWFWRLKVGDTRMKGVVSESG